MEKYDYEEQVKSDVCEYVLQRCNEDILLLKDYTDKQLYEQFYDDIFIEDSVTGNASGSYFCNAWKAEEALCHNMDLLNEALQEFCCDSSYLEKGSEACDVTIRCYLFPRYIQEAIDDARDELGIEEYYTEPEEEEEE